MKRALASLALLLAAAPAAHAEPVPAPDLPPPDIWVRTDGGQIRVLDKQKAQSQLLTVKLGQPVTFETLQITLLACVVHPPGVVENQAGFLQVTDSREGEPGFRGWMLSRQPGLAMMQSPVYGVRVVGCDKPTPEAITAALPPKPPPPEPPPPDAAQPDAPASPTRPPHDSDLNPPAGQDLEPPPQDQ